MAIQSTRRVLLVLLLIVSALPWLSRPVPVNAQGDTAPKSSPESAPAEAPSANATNTTPATSTARLSVPTGGIIGVVEIEGPILYENQFDSIKRRVDRAINDGADLIVFDLDTPGGALIIALDISSYIRTLPVPTVAWINDRALSAGILIASACDEIVMSKASLTGDCAPIIPGQSLAPTERAKALSPLLAEFRANASDNHNGQTTSDFALFHAMCVLGIDVFEVRHKTTGEVRMVSQADYAVMVDGKSPIDVAKAGNTASISALDDPEKFTEGAQPLVTVNNPAEVGQWELVKQVHNGNSQLLLTMNETESLDVGLSRATVSSEAELQKLYGAASVTRYEETWSESLVGFLMHPVVRGCLLLLGAGGLLLEFFSPGLFVPGIVGVIAIGIMIGTPYFVGMAQTWHLLLIVVGAGLIIFELLTMTTFGVLALLGLLLFLAGLVLSGVQSATNGLPAPGTARQIFISSMSFVGAVMVSIPMLFVLMRYFGTLPVLNKLVLNASQVASSGMAQPHQRVSGDESMGGGTIKPGMIGVVSSTGLRPAGRVDIEDQLVDVTSTGAFIDPGEQVRVVEVHGNMITVERDGQV